MKKLFTVLLIVLFCFLNTAACSATIDESSELIPVVDVPVRRYTGSDCLCYIFSLTFVATPPLVCIGLLIFAVVNGIEALTYVSIALTIVTFLFTAVMFGDNGIRESRLRITRGSY